VAVATTAADKSFANSTMTLFLVILLKVLKKVDTPESKIVKINRRCVYAKKVRQRI
jgi:hypothetical protein